MNEKKHFHHKFIACEKEDFKMGTEVTVQGYLTENDALEAAKKIITRPYWHLNNVFECAQCAALEEQLAMQRYQMTLLGKYGREDD